MMGWLAEGHETIENPLSKDRKYLMVIVVSPSGRTYIGGCVSYDDDNMILFKPLVITEFVSPDGRGNIGFNKPFFIASLPDSIEVKCDCVIFLNGSKPDDQRAVSGYERAYNGLLMNQAGLIPPSQLKQ